jgi:hypothetical protein
MGRHHRSPIIERLGLILSPGRNWRRLSGRPDYAAVGATVSRFPRRQARDAALAKTLRGISGGTMGAFLAH